MLFDGQASTFFSYLIEKIGIEKIKRAYPAGEEGKESREFITQPDVLGPDFEKIEADWATWVKDSESTDRTAGPGRNRIPITLTKNEIGTMSMQKKQNAGFRFLAVILTAVLL